MPIFAYLYLKSRKILLTMRINAYTKSNMHKQPPQHSSQSFTRQRTLDQDQAAIRRTPTRVRSLGKAPQEFIKRTGLALAGSTAASVLCRQSAEEWRLPPIRPKSPFRVRSFSKETIAEVVNAFNSSQDKIMSLTKSRLRLVLRRKCIKDWSAACTPKR